MAYATSINVQNLLPTGYTIGVSPAPSVAQVTELLNQCAYEIDEAVASRGLVVPVTSPAWFVNGLLTLNAQGAVGLALQQIYPFIQGQPASVGEGSQSVPNAFLTRYQARLTMIRKGDGIPVGAPVYESDLGPRSYLTDNGGAMSPDGQATDAWGDQVFGDTVLPMRKVY